MEKRRLHMVYVRPSTYDDDGYVLRFWRGVLPSNTLGCLEGLTEAVALSGALGPGVDVTVEVFDDTVQRMPIKRLARMNRRENTRVVVGFVGVQTNQFSRASDLALELRDEGIQVMMGGFHVSGKLALFGEPTQELRLLLDHGVTLVRGEAEAPGKLVEILQDALDGRMQPIYNILEMPDLLNAPVPRMLAKLQKRFVSKEMATIDTSRGCPFNCSFCTIINVQGRKMRYRAASCVLEAMEENYRRGIKVYFFTDDNFSRNPVWEQIFDGLIEMKKRGINIIFMMQIDTQAHRIPGFIEKAAQAGCYLVFVGMETVNAKNLEAIGKKQNHVSEYAAMVQSWHDLNILVHVGYIIGLPHDTRESIRMDMETLRSEVKVDFASLFMLTPLPGSRDQWQMVQDCVPTDADENNYDGLHETFRHPMMPPGQWRAAYDDAMHLLYSKEHIVNVLLRAATEHRGHLFWTFIWYRYSALEGIHPMATGLLRLKDRKSRRPIFPRESVGRYAWRRVKDSLHGAKRYAGIFFDFQEVWMLTRKPEDPRWIALADLRARWADVQKRLVEYDIRGKYDDASVELRAMLSATAEKMRQISKAPVHLSGFARRGLVEKAKEVEAYVRAFDLEVPGWHKIINTEKYISEKIVAGYEEIAFRSVAQRRKFNGYRHDIAERVRSGRVLTVDLVKMTLSMGYEVYGACKFGAQILWQLAKKTSA